MDFDFILAAFLLVYLFFYTVKAPGSALFYFEQLGTQFSGLSSINKTKIGIYDENSQKI